MNPTTTETVVMPSGAAVQLMVPVASTHGSRTSAAMGVAEGMSPQYTHLKSLDP